ncbi:venom allergen 5 [Plakobranchus ocellatus]|uniref:Venom allergen 5 n=1 Tax=Plakobranchus ocellatus TaxID=259542 RepID=A0AAV4DYY3_9GAST|nr:venom allergen 5 [Plakobranchus ocellatus]
MFEPAPSPAPTALPDRGTKQTSTEPSASTKIEAFDSSHSPSHSIRLELNDELTSLAQQWADTLAQSKDLSRHNFKYKGTRIGQSITMKWAPNRATYDPEELCDQWYRECRDFDFGVEPTELKAGHFTQMVWKNSTEIGVGRSQARDGRSIVVVNYFPPGNVIGEFNANVLPQALNSPSGLRMIASAMISRKPSFKKQSRKAS